MKKYMITVGIALLGLTSVQAQKIDFGVKAGVNLSDLKGKDIADTEMKTGLYIGGYANLGLSDNIFFQPEVLFSMQGASMDEEDEAFTLNYLNVPLMFQYGINENLKVELGPQVGFLLKADFDNGEQEIDVKEQMSSIDFGMNLGATYQLDNGLNFSARYNLGLSDVYDSDLFDSEAKNAVISVGIGYKL